METFELIYEKKKKDDLIQVLLSDGTWLNDEEMTQLFALMAWQKSLNPVQDVRLIWPSVSKMLMEHETRRADLVTPEVRALFRDDVPPLLLLPIASAGHWSLLYYRRQVGRWYHMDSIKGYHAQYAHQVLNTLCFLCCLSTSTRDKGRGFYWDGQIHTFERVPRQRGSWQCGTTVLLFMLVVCESVDDSDIQQHIHMTGESYRHALVKHLINLLLTVYSKTGFYTERTQVHSNSR
jgi:hypothetical protein